MAKVGRPTKYNDEMITLANAYIEQHKEHGDPVPIVAGLAVELGVSKATVYKWAGENPEFSDTLARLNSKQEKMLVNGSLTNELNSVISKLMLHNHDYSDKSQVQQSGKFTVQNVGLNTDFGEPEA